MPGSQVASFGRDKLLEVAIAKGVNYDRDTITSRSPSKQQVLLALKKKGITEPEKELEKIQILKRRLKLKVLVEKAKDLGVYSDYIRDDEFKLAIHIYFKNPVALEDLSRYQRSEPKVNTILYNSKTQLTLAQWIGKESDLRVAVAKKLSSGNGDSIATLDKIIPVGRMVRCEIGIDDKKRIVERKQSPQFPHRKGSYDAYPLRRIHAMYDLGSNTIQVSSHPEKTPLLMEVFSGVLTGTQSNFEIRKPSADQAADAFADEDIQRQLSENNIRVTEIFLTGVPMRGNPSQMHLKGENLLETIAQMKECGIHIIGRNLAKISEVTFELDGKNRIKINFNKHNRTRTGDFTEQDEYKVREILSKWGV